MSRIHQLFIFTFFTATVFLSQQTLANEAVGFQNGNQIKVNRITGNLYLTCQDPFNGMQQRWVRCDADLWSPGLTDFFVGPKVNASKVTLTATRADGSQRSSDKDYIGAEGRSKSRFNLGISTLTQKPLLREGTNLIHFSLTDGNETLAHGEFTTTVTRGAALQCPQHSEWGTSHDCNFPQSACERYFQYYNYCQ